ncbi:nitrate- and nitrite sensing domain-containing protein [Nonomuraea sp. NPDC003804]|uniref:nitrate- and nitrite sensing domain-containing protein n=1 Tax=Nonomuraea sp. NPDC003804 TaxID=3154547 RepID=UPI0033A4F141
MLLSLAALWAFAAWVTLREGINLLWVAQLDSSVIGPSEPLLVELQRERRASMMHLAEVSTGSQEELHKQRQRADRFLTDFRTAARADIVEWATDDDGERRLDELFAKLDGLPKVRAAVDAGRTSRIKASRAYADIIDSFYPLYGSLATIDDKTVAKDIRTLMTLSRAREIMATEDALLAGALAAGRLSAEEHAQFIKTVGAWRVVADQAAAELPSADRAAYDKLLSGPVFTRLSELENLLAEYGQSTQSIPFGAEQWKATTEQALADFNTMVLTAGDGVVDRATPVAAGVVMRLVLAGGLGLIAVIASIVLSITTARSLFAQLQKLRDAAHELSDERLPRVVERIGHGEHVDVSVEAPPLQVGADEIGQVGQAFNTVQETAIRIAAEQAALRQSIRDILLSLARRTQGLVHRQLSVLDVMERRETDPEDLKELFRLDHLAIRMRRNAENLIVLSGASPARTWRNSVPMVDVVRGALAEVEDYTRVDILPMGDVVLVGRAVGDVIHLLAELIENAASFSPPYTNVQVSGQFVANGYVVEVEDRGLGMKPEDLDAANDRIANPPEFRITGTTARLGLYVVSRLAERHGIQVSLRSSAYGGTTVVVLLPRELVETDQGRPDDDPEADLPAGLPRRQTAAPAAGRTATFTAPRPRTAQHSDMAHLSDLAQLSEIAQVSDLAQRSGTAQRSGSAQRPHPDLDPHPDPDSRPGPDSRPQLDRRPVRDSRPAPDSRPELDSRPGSQPRSAPQLRTVPPLGGPDTTPAPGAAPSSTASPAADLPKSPPAGRTPSGLPLRVPQANLAPALRDEAPATPPSRQDDGDERSPEEIRAMMGSLQMGSKLGRSEAAKLMQDDRSGDDE